MTTPTEVLRQARRGDYAMVRHRGEDEWQERLITWREDEDDRVCMLSPDEDHYEVEPTIEFQRVYILGPRRGLPREVRKSTGLIYRFDRAYSDDELARIFAEAVEIATEKGMIKARAPFRLRRKGPMPALRDAAAPPPPRGVGGAAAAGPLLPVAVPPRVGRGPSELWLLAEPTESLDIGYDVSSYVMRETVSGGAGLCSVGHEILRCELVDPKDVEIWKVSWQERWERVARRLAAVLTPRGEPPRPSVEAEADARVQLVYLDEAGRRDIKFVDAVRGLSEVALPDWDLDGPRTVVYCAKEVARTGAPPMMRFRQWKTENRLGDEDAGVDFCEVAAEVLELAVCRDQLNIGNLLCFERLERKRQMIEESYRQKAEEARLLKAISSNPMAMTNELFSGRLRMAGGAIVCPSLIEYVARKAAENSEILKQQRKAIEVRGLAAPKAAGKK